MWAASMTELLVESLPGKLRPRGAKVLRHLPASSVPMGNTSVPWQTPCCQTLQKSGSFRCHDVPYIPCLAPFQVTQRHLYAKAILQKPLGNCWWFLYSQPVHPSTLAILPPPVLVHRVENGDVLRKQLTRLSLQEDFCLGHSRWGRWPSLTK